MKGHIITGIILLILFRTATINIGKNGTKEFLYRTVHKITNNEVIHKVGRNIADAIGFRILKAEGTVIKKKTISEFRESFTKEIAKDTKSLEKIIPYENGGINSEKRTLKEICKQPIPQKLLMKLDNMGLSPESLRLIKRDLEKMGSNTVPLPAQNKHVDFHSISWPGVNPKLPDKEELVKIILKKKNGLNIKDINDGHIRKVSYDIAHNALAEKYGITKKEAKHIIGTLDLVIHESESGIIEIIPNNIHRFKQLYAHRGYVAIMMKKINGKIIDD